MAGRKRVFLKVVVIFVAVAGLLFTSAISLVYFKQQNIVNQLIESYNLEIKGKLELEKTRISPFRNFPYISIDLQNVKLFETKQDESPFLFLEDVYVGFNFWQLLKGRVELKKILIQGGFIQITAHTNASYNILNALEPLNPTLDTSATNSIAVNLESITLKKLKVIKNRDGGTNQMHFNFNQMKASFDMNEKRILTSLNGGLVLSWQVKDSFLLKEKYIETDSKLSFENEEQLLKIIQSQVRLQGINLEVKGSADLDDDMKVDVNVHGEKSDFSLLFAFLPDELEEFMKRYKNAGNIFFDANIQGKTMNGFKPLVNASFGCKNGYFKNEIVNRTLDGLSFQGSFTNGEKRDLSTSEFSLVDFQAKPEEGIVKASIVVRNFEDPYVNTQVETDFDLQFLADFLQLSQLQNVKGRVVLRVNYNELVDISNSKEVLSGVKKGVDSRLIVTNLSFKFPNYPLMFHDINIDASMRESKLSLDKLNVSIGESDLSAKGYISDLPALMHKLDQDIELAFNCKSAFVDLYALTAYDTLNKKPIQENIKNFSSEFKFMGKAKNLFNANDLPLGDFKIENLHAEFKNYPHILQYINAQLSIREDELRLSQFDAKIDKSDLHAFAVVNNYKKWFMPQKEGRSTIQFRVNSTHLFPNDLLSYNGVNYVPEEYKNEDISNLIMNGKIDLTFVADSLKSYDVIIDKAQAKLKLHPFKLENIAGRIHGENNLIQTENLSIKLGKSDFNLSMRYNLKSKSAENHFTLQSKNLDFDELSNYQVGNPPDPNDMKAHEDSFNIFRIPFSNTRVSFNVGKMNYHKILLSNVKGRLRMKENHIIYIDTMSMDIAEGHIDLKGKLDGSNPDNIVFLPDFKLSKLDLNKVMIKADNFGQEYIVNDNIKGLLSGNISGKVPLYPDLFPQIKGSELAMDLSLKNGVMVNFAPLRALSSFMGDKNLNYVRFDTLQNVFTFKNNELSFPKMNISSSLGFIELSGRQNLDLNMDYVVSIPWSLVSNVGANKLFGGRNKEDIPENQIDDIVKRDATKRTRFIRLSITGTPDQMKISRAKASNKESL